MLAVVTSGPATEPIDAVRQITNRSSGELGTMLCQSLVATDWDVVCLCGEMSAHRPAAPATLIPFSTNDSLWAALQNLSAKPHAIFHAAALCDFTVARVEGAPTAQKIRSDAEELHLTLKPARKVLPDLPAFFPRALIVGWKYELDGTRADALARGRRQIEIARTRACVVNGAAYGEGFGFIEQGRKNVPHFATKQTLSDFLADWAAQQIK